MIDTNEIDKVLYEKGIPDGSINKAIKNMKRSIDMMRVYWRLWEKSPWDKLDEKIKGIIKWKVYTIWAYSNTGKSKFSYHWVNHFLWLGKSVIFFSLEVDSGMVLQNLMCNKYELQFKDFTDTWAINNLIGRDYDNLKIYDTVYDLSRIEEIVKHYKPDYVFIDFIQNIQTTQGSNYEKLAKIAIAVQQLAITTWSTIFSLSQLSNNTAKNVGRWDTSFISLKGAGELFASSDVIFLLKREDENILWLKIVKNKYWRVDDEFYFDVDFSRWQFKLRNIE